MADLLTIMPDSWPRYFFYAFVISLVVRIISSFFRMLETHIRSLLILLKIFIGTGYKNWSGTILAEDNTLGFWIGFLELLVYPILIRTENLTYIGAWLAFKTVHRWNYAPGVERGYYNRYLLNNALILVSSYLFARNLFELWQFSGCW